MTTRSSAAGDAPRTGGATPGLTLAAAFIVCTFLARLPAMVEPIGIDQGIFATAGWGLSEGLGLYRDVWDQKPPGIHLMYLAGAWLLGPAPDIVFWLDLLAGAGTCALLYALALRADGRRAALAVAGVYAVLMLPAARYGYGGFLERAVPECFIAALVSAAALLTVSEPASTRKAAAAALLIGMAVLFKPTAMIYWPALAFFAYGWRPPAYRRLFSTLVLLAVPVAFVSVWLWRDGALLDAWIAVVEYNRAYIGAGSGIAVLADRLAHELWRLVKSDPLWLLGTAGLLIAAADALRARRRPPALPALAAVWLAAAIVAAAANGVRLYSNYFIPSTPPLALAAGWLVSTASASRGPRRAAVPVAILLACAVAVRSHYPTRLWSTTLADARAWRARGDERLAYLERFGGYKTGRGYSARANAELTTYLMARTSPADRLYIFGMAPSVYFTARRLPANRFVWTYPGVVDFVHRPEFTVEALAADLGAAAPAYLVLERNNRDTMTGWRIEAVFESPAVRSVLAGYDRETEIEDFVLYRRRPTAGATSPASK